ncbi:MAG: ATP-binding protein [Bacillota bacterium]
MTKSLFSRMMVTYLLIIAVMVMALTVYLPGRVSAYFVRATEERLTTKGQEFLPLARNFLLGRQDYSTTIQLLAVIEQVLDSNTWIVAPNGQILATSPAGGALARGVRLEPSELAQVMEGQVVSRQGTIRNSSQVMISVGIPVTTNQNGGTVIGALFLHAPLVNVQATALVVRRQIMLTALAAMLIALGLAFSFSRSLSQPLGLMNKAALAMAQGDFSKRVDSSHEDEIGQLANSFNFLAGSLQDSIASLKTEKGRMENLLTSLTEGVVATDEHGALTLFNPAAAELLGLDQAPQTGSQLSKTELPAELAQWMTAEKTDQVMTKTLQLGEDRVLAVTISPVADTEGRTTGQMAVLQDVTEAHRLEQLRRDFVANVSHELRTPLTSIRGFVEGILDETIPMSSAPRYLNIIHRETIRLTRLIHELLDLSHIESGKTVLHREPITLNSMIISLATQARAATRQEQLHLRLALDDSDPVVDADPDRIGQVLLNLITNACKFTPSDGSVTITTRIEGDHLTVQVADTGPGIPPEDLPYVWDRFYKADRSRSKEGVGLGLAIVRSLVEAHGESITVSNTEPHGAVFAFQLPLAVKDHV